MALRSVSWTLYSLSYLPIPSIGEDLKETTFLGGRRAYHVRYLILNFGNVVNLDFGVW
jgi:hypothetical protein